MKTLLFALILFMIFMSLTIDDTNRVYKPLHNFPMRGGGGWPSTTGNPSGGGRWNN